MAQVATARQTRKCIEARLDFEAIGKPLERLLQHGLRWTGRVIRVGMARGQKATVKHVRWSMCWVFMQATCAGTTAICGDAERPAAQFSAQEIKEAILVSPQRVSSLKVSYKAGGYDPKKVRAGMYVHRTVIAKAPHSLFHDSGHGYDGFPWQEDLFRQTAYITATHTCNTYPINRAYFRRELRPDEGLPGSLPYEMFFLATGLWPLTGRQAPRPNGHPHMLHEIAQSDDYDQVREHQDMVDGRWCHVLRSESRDSLWLDVSRGCCLMQREISDTDTGALKTRFVLGGYREVGEGVWMPSWIRFVQFDFTAATAQGRKRKVRDTPIEILGISVNDVDNGVFQYSPPPGALELDSNDVRALPKQSRLGGLDHLDSLVNWLHRHSAAGIAQKNSWRDYAYVLPLLLVLVLILLCEAWVRLRKSSGRRGHPLEPKGVSGVFHGLRESGPLV